MELAFESEGTKGIAFSGERNIYPQTGLLFWFGIVSINRLLLELRGTARRVIGAPLQGDRLLKDFMRSFTMISGFTNRRRLCSRVWNKLRRIRRFSLETLEERCVLSGNAPDLQTNWFAEVTDAESIQASLHSTHRQWLVQLSADAVTLAGDVSGAESLLQATGTELQVLRGLGLPGAVLVATTLPEVEVETQFAGNPWIRSFELNRVVGAQLLPNDPQFASGAQHSLENDGVFGMVDADIDAAAAWELTTGDPGVVVGVIDSGVALDHPDLYQNIWIHQGEIPSTLRADLEDTDADSLITFRDLNQAGNASYVTDFNTNGYIDAYDLLADPRWSDGVDNEANGFVDDLFGWDFVDGGDSPQLAGDNNPTDEHGHGTHVAGTIAAIGDNGIGVTGITWSTSIMPLRFLDENRSGLLADAISAINYATTMRSQFDVNMPVTNNSWGYRGEESEMLRAALEANAAADMLFVAAAGNGDALGLGVDNDADPLFSFYPASDDLNNVVSVAATDSRDRLARFSNFGAATVDIAAPGVGIVSTDPVDQGNGGYAIRSGTSMAAPLVAGVAALVVAANPLATTAEVKAAVLDAAAIDTLAELNGKVATGGRLNAFGALSVDRIAPRVHIVSLPDLDGPGVAEITIEVVFTDNRALDPSSIDGGEILVADLFDGSVLSDVTLISSVIGEEGGLINATYRIAAPDGAFQSGDYEISLNAGEVFDTAVNAARQTVLGSFNVDTTPNLLRASELTDNGSMASLREAVLMANASLEPNTIRLAAGTYLLSLTGNDDLAMFGDLDLMGQLTIKGAGADKTIVDAASLDRVFHVLPGAAVELRDLSITGGSALEGGGIMVADGGVLLLRRTMIYGNDAETGGGIYNAGSLEVNQSTIHHNSATIEGGGLFIAATAAASLENATISTNTATTAGAVFNSGSLELRSSTVAANQSISAAGGVVNDAGVTTVVNTIVADNTNATSGMDVHGAVNSLGFNLIEISAGSSGWVASDLLESDPLLGPLQFNGGNVETVAVWTHVPQVHSPAIDAGHSSAAPAIDQRGIARPLDGNRDTIAVADIGAVERYFGSVQGVRFLDENENGIRDDGETVLAGLAVYIDTDQDEQYDNGEPIAFTEADGSYQFTGLAPGTYSVIDLPQQGWRQIRSDFGTELELSSQGSGLLQANAHSSSPALSADGRFVAFSSSASNLVVNDANFSRDVFLYDRAADNLEMISVNAAGLPGNGDSYRPAISADGNIVVSKAKPQISIRLELTPIRQRTFTPLIERPASWRW